MTEKKPFYKRWLPGKLQREHVGFFALFFLISGGLWAFMEIADEVGEGETHKFDTAILLSLRHETDLADPIGPGWMEEMVRDITALGSHFFLILSCVAVIGYLLMRGKRLYPTLIAASVVTGMTATSFLKEFFDRPRPDLVAHGAEVYSMSFPSGHAMLSAVTFLTLGALLARLQEGPKRMIYVLFVAAFLTIIVGLSRIYMGVHWPTDVLAGWAMGSVWALATWFIAAYIERRRAKGDRESPPPMDADEAETPEHSRA